MPADETVLLTLLHISDLHFHDRLGAPAGNDLDARVTHFVRLHPIFDGQLGHHHDALTDLEDFCAKLRILPGEPAEGPLLLVTGDLSASGAPEQVVRAETFLHGQLDTSRHLRGANLLSRIKQSIAEGWRSIESRFLGRRRPPPAYIGTGLQHPVVRTRAIPGNHDQWPGRRLWTTELCWPHGRSQIDWNVKYGLPDCDPLVLPSGHRLELIRINSDRNVGPWSAERRKAQGAFVDELTELDGRLTLPDDRTIRVLLLHHSPSWRHYAGHLEITQPSAMQLEAFLVRHRISVVLTGHTHEPLLDFIIAWDGPARRHVLEACCGTTTVRDAFPPTWHMGRDPPPNILMIHRIVETDSRLLWRTETHFRQRLPGQLGFGSPGMLDAEATRHGLNLEAELVPGDPANRQMIMSMRRH